MERMTNEEKAQEIINKHWEWIADFIEKNNLSKEDRNQIRFQIYGACLDMAKWKDEQYKEREEGLQGTINAIDARLQKSNESGLHYFDKYNNEKCKLEELQANYDELKRRYDEAVEREKIATKIINELKQRK